MSGCEVGERDGCNMMRLKLEGYFFIPASLWTGLVTEHARGLKELALCSS